jgi:hypothetical protein
MTFAPAHEAHSIDRTSVTVAFGASVSPEAWVPIFVRAAEIGRDKEFKILEAVSAGVLTIGGGLGAPPSLTTQILSGIGFQKLAEDGAPLVDFTVQRNEIRIGSNVYVRWSGFRQLVLDLLTSLLDAFPSEGAVTQIRLEYWDRFINLDGRAPWGEVVRADGRLPAWVVNSPTNWHCHLGWFDGIEPPRLVNVNVDTLDEPNDKGGSVQTLRLYTLTGTAGLLAPTNFVSKTLGSELDELHRISKCTVQQVLSIQMTERISLFPRGET